jgi:hypothetical protein
MRRTTVLPALLVCLLALAALPAAAGANATDDRILRDCNMSATGALTGSYTNAQLRHAKNNLPGDALEYSGCFDAIRQALLAKAGAGGPNGEGGGGSGASGGGTGTGGGDGTAGGVPPVAPGTPPHTGTKAPVEIAGTAIQPGALPSIGHDTHELPTALVVMLALLGLAALAPVTLTIGRRVVARRRA